MIPRWSLRFYTFSSVLTRWSKRWSCCLLVVNWGVYMVVVQVPSGRGGVNCDIDIITADKNWSRVGSVDRRTIPATRDRPSDVLECIYRWFIVVIKIKFKWRITTTQGHRQSHSSRTRRVSKKMQTFELDQGISAIPQPRVIIEDHCGTKRKNYINPLLRGFALHYYVNTL